MTSTVLDHTQSEARLNRVLYFIKYMRAMLLNMVLVLAALALFLVAGIEGLYPMADDTIRAIKAHMATVAAQQPGTGPATVVFTAVFSAVFVAAFFAWMYLAITNRWRIALWCQAAFLLLSAMFAPVWAWPQVQFAIAHLPPLFTALVFAGFAIMIWMVLDLCVALWRVSRSPETASLRATLDRRLTRGWWSYINKLVDLPRTPLATLKNLAAYVLAFAGAILLIACINYVVSVGIVSNKLSLLFAACNAERMPTCRAQAEAWSLQIPIWLGLSVVGLKVAGLMQSTAKRLDGMSVSDALRHSGQKFLLYLRPFSTDDVVLPKPRLPLLSRLLTMRPYPVRIEEELFDVADGYMPLIAVGAPGRKAADTGDRAYREFLADSEWQAFVADKLQRAEAVVIVIKDTQGVRWELSRITTERTHLKTLFLFDPSAKDQATWYALAGATIEQLAAAGLVPPGFRFHGQALGFYFRGNDVVEVHNAHWSTTSYRTAFSEFLGERVAAVRAANGAP